MVDPDPENNPIRFSGDFDRGAVVASADWAKCCDVIVNHSGLGKELDALGKPVIHVAHGRPRHSFNSECGGGTPIYSYHYSNNAKTKIKAVVTFWEQQERYLKVMYPNKPVFTVQSPVDLDYWAPTATTYDFAGTAGVINIVCADAFRDDIDAFVPINAFALWARENQGAKLHLFGKPKNADRGWSALLKRVSQDGNLGVVQGWASDLRPVYSAADLVLTAHEIDVRTVREATASGCPVLRIKSDLSNYREIGHSIKSDRKLIRIGAVNNFNPDVTAKQFLKIIEMAKAA